MTTQTTNLSLNKPAQGDTDWTTEINDNWDTLDAAVNYVGSFSGGYVTKDGSNLKFAPDKSNSVFLYESSSWNRHAIADAGITVGCTGLTASTIYYLYVYDNSGTLTLDLSTTTHTTQNGIKVKTGATDRLLIAICRTDSSGDVQDSETQRFICNIFNKRLKHLRSYNTNTSWTCSSSTMREFNAGTGQVRAEFVTDGTTSIHIVMTPYALVSSYRGFFKVGFDSVTGSGSMARLDSGGYVFPAEHAETPAEGYHYVTCLERAYSGSFTVYSQSGAYSVAQAQAMF